MSCYLRSVRLDEFITEFRKSGKAIKEFDRKSPPSALGEKALYLTLSEIVFTGRSISKDRLFLKYKRYLLHICDRIAMLVRK